MKRLDVVAAALVRNGKVLAARRPSRSVRQYWEFPGGKVERGETDIDALFRELREELGVTVEIERAIGRSLHKLHTRTIDLRVYFVRLVEGEPRAHVHEELRWLGPDELREVHWSNADVPLLPSVERILRHEGSHPTPLPQ